MQTKEQKRLVALERIEKKLLDECRKVDNNHQKYTLNSPALRLENTRLLVYLNQANDIRRALNYPLLSLSTYDIVRGNLVIKTSVSEFYPN